MPGGISFERWEKKNVHHPAPEGNFLSDKKKVATEEIFRW